MIKIQKKKINIIMYHYVRDIKISNYPNLKKLENSYWSDLINNHHADNTSEQIQIKASKIISYLYIFKYKYQQFVNRYLKILIFYLKKLKKFINLVNR